MKMKATRQYYQNGNASISIDVDGTRIIQYPSGEKLTLEYPLNIDIRLSNRCPLGFNPKTGKAVCTFCHESARTDGVVGDIERLKNILDTQLPKDFAIELAVGVNEMLPEIADFFAWATKRGFIINATVNQLTVSSNRQSTQYVTQLIQNGNIKGLGLSFRNVDTFTKVPKEIIEYGNTVVHVIAGIDDIEEVKKLAKMGVKKVLVLGEKEFGFNVDLFHNAERIQNRKLWLWKIHELFKLFDVVSFDNLALEQLKVKRFFLDEKEWNTTYQGEHSFYINAVDGYFAPSSRSYYKVGFDKATIQSFFKEVIEHDFGSALKESQSSLDFADSIAHNKDKAVAVKNKVFMLSIA